MNREKLIELKNSIELLEAKKEDFQKKKQEFEENNKFLIDEINALNTNISECKEILTENALAGYDKDMVKKRLGGIGIRVMKILEYDEKQAFDWAKEKDLFLQLDKRSFENVAKTGEIPFVNIIDKPTVTFPKTIILDD